MLVVIAFATVYPAGLLLFIFAPVPVQWAWLGYQLCTMVAMHAYRFWGGELVGTTEERVAEALDAGKTVSMCCAAHDEPDGGSLVVVATAEVTVVSSVAEGRLEVERLVERWRESNSQG